MKKNIEENSKLKEITLYTKPNTPLCENYKKTYKEQGIKFNEKDITLHNEVSSTIQLNAVPVIFVNDNYLAHGRDFQNPQQSISAIRHFANSEYIIPSFNHKLLESIKNLQFSLNKGLQNLNRSIQPIVKVMNELAQEESEQKNN